jgi:prolyl oligopeptidase
MIPRIHVHRLAATAIALLAVGAAAADPPPTPSRPVVDTYHGVEVSDPYRWMEDSKSAEFRAWLQGQNAYTEETLAKIEGRARLRARVLELAQQSPTARELEPNGDLLFYLAGEPGHRGRRLVVENRRSGERRVLVDPAALEREGKPVAVDWFKASADGSKVALGLSEGGSEDSTLRVLDVRTGAWLAERIDRTGINGAWTIVWLPDNRRFFYERTPEGERYDKSRLYLHELGRDPARDPPLWGYGLHPEIRINGHDYTYLRTAPGSEHVVAVVVPGVANERRFYSARLADLVAGKARWRLLAGGDAQWFRGYLRGNDLYVLSHDAAPRNKLLRVDLSRPGSEPEVALPGGSAVLSDAVVARDALYVSGLDAGVGRVFRVPYARGRVTSVALPFEGSVREMAADPRRDGLLVRLEGWTQSPRILAVANGSVRDTHMLAPASADFSGIAVTRTAVASHDGVQVPLTVLARKDVALDGSNPTIVTGYGAYGFASEPRFDPKLLAWLERGGVYAVAHVRGGGEYGEEWHNAGRLLTKSNTILDFVACAQYLAGHGYTRPAKLAGTGGSAGGITIGGAITERPDLFAAALDNVGMSDDLRAELQINGPANIPEFGTVKNADDFKNLLAISAFHRLKDHTAYPAVLLTTGINDPRVDPWQMNKMTARLQAASSSGKPVLLRVDYDAGHGGIGATKSQHTALLTDQYSFLLWQLGDPEFAIPGAPAKGRSGGKK